MYLIYINLLQNNKDNLQDVWNLVRLDYKTSLRLHFLYLISITWYLTAIQGHNIAYLTSIIDLSTSWILVT